MADCAFSQSPQSEQHAALLPLPLTILNQNVLKARLEGRNLTLYCLSLQIADFALNLPI